MGSHTLPLYFNVVSAMLHEAFGDEDSKQVGSTKLGRTTSLLMRLKLEDRPFSLVTLSSGEELKDIFGSVRVSPQPKELTESSATIGSIQYSGPVPADEFHRDIPAAYFLKVSVPEKQFEDLLAVARDGRMPTQIEVRVAGLELPTEFETRWDTKSSPTLHVTYVSYAILLAAVQLDDSEKPEFFTPIETPSFYPVTRADFSRMANESKVLAEGLLRRMDKIVWLIGLIGAVGLVLLLFKR